jgi:hypothetical protein
VDFIDDSGTVSGMMGEREINIMKNNAEEDILIETVKDPEWVKRIGTGVTIFNKETVPGTES